MTTEAPVRATVLSELSAALSALNAALATGRADAVLAAEPRLAAAVADVRAVLASADGTPLDPGERATVDVLRDLMARCRRCGSTVPTLLSVMFPGQVTYGPAGARVTAPATAPGWARVI